MFYLGLCGLYSGALLSPTTTQSVCVCVCVCPVMNWPSVHGVSLPVVHGIDSSIPTEDKQFGEWTDEYNKTNKLKRNRQ